MNKINFSGFFFSIAAIAYFMVTPLVNGQPVENTAIHEYTPPSVVLIDGVPYQAEAVEICVRFWDEESAAADSKFGAQFRKHFNAYMKYLETCRVMPSIDSPEIAGFLERLSGAALEYDETMALLDSLIREKLSAYMITENVSSYTGLATKEFSTLFQRPPVIVVDGNPYLASVVSIVQKKMAATSKTQWAHISGGLENILIQMYSARKSNSGDVSKWALNWGNFFLKPGKELFGIWGDECKERINRGVDTELPQRYIAMSMEKAEILLSGFINALYCGSSSFTGGQTMGWDEYLAPYTLPQYTASAADLLGLDLANWQNGVINRIEGAGEILLTGLDIAVVIISKFNPLAVIIGAVFKAGEAAIHGFTRDSKAAKLQAEFEASLDDELKWMLTMLRYIPKKTPYATESTAAAVSKI